MTRPALAHLLGAIMVPLSGCTSVLGMDAPTLAGSTRDAGMEATADASDAASESSAMEASCAEDAAPDAVPPGVRCGGGCFGVTYCTGSNAVCCQRTNDAGVTTYGCTSSETACDGYPIVCASDDDCPGSDICCHFNSKTTCDTTTACPSSGLICRPGMPIDCPTGKACDVSAVNAGVTSPYFLCQP